ncbi:MAG: hypothetical protein M0010_09630 [Actinomycetota bacterium]|nr:hypothetical protein [Actinomycetota bacterium]
MSGDAPAPSGALPLLALPYRPTALSPWALADAARDVCRLLWITDETAPVDPVTIRLLRRLGDVTDLAGCSRESWRERLATFRPNGIAAFSDHNMVRIAEAAADLGLRFHSPGAATVLTDKYAQRAALRSGGVESPGCWIVPSAENPRAVAALASRLDYPVVLKPRNGADSRLTFRVDDESQLLGILATPEVATCGLAMVIEEYLQDGPALLDGRVANYLSVESVVSAGVIRHLATTGRLPQATPFRETCLFIPSTLAGSDREAVLALATRAILALGIEHGFLHTEIKLTPAGPRIIEVNGRLGGGVPAMYQLLTGMSLISFSMRVALGESVHPAEISQDSSVAYRLLVQAPVEAARVEGTEGLDEVGKIEGVSSVSLNRPAGSRLDWRLGNRDYVFAVLGSARDHRSLLDTIQQISQVARIRYSG